VSVAVNGNLVYVLNQLGIANITGFIVNDLGALQPIPLSTRELAGGALALPAQVSFTPDGTQLLVTEKGTNTIDIFQLQPDGRTSGPTAQQSSGKTPFGFAIGADGTVVVSEVENRLPLQGTASSYRLTGGSSLLPVSPHVPDNQSGACWVAITGDIAWVTNTGSANISAYQIGAGGSLTLVNPIAGTTGDGTAPIDLAASADGSFLYVLKSATGEIAAFAINGSSLTPLFTETGLPLSIQGIVAR
jgi:DNA-binding beta-propeller fold protein YncE